MLEIVNGVAVAHFTGGQQIRIPASADRPWLETHHRAHAGAAGANRAPQHPHEPVDAAGLLTGAVDFARLVEKLSEDIGVPHEAPRADVAMKRDHRRDLGLPGGA
jgi:hypothetical protein